MIITNIVIGRYHLDFIESNDRKLVTDLQNWINQFNQIIQSRFIDGQKKLKSRDGLGYACVDEGIPKKLLFILDIITPNSWIGTSHNEKPNKSVVID